MKSVIRNLLLLLIILVGAGYFSAFVSIDQCTEITKTVAAKNNQIATSIIFKPVDSANTVITSRIYSPFLVESEYQMPYGMHARYHVHRYYTVFGLVFFQDYRTFIIS